jgi:hypothetical protein
LHAREFGVSLRSFAVINLGAHPMPSIKSIAITAGIALAVVIAYAKFSSRASA